MRPNGSIWISPDRTVIYAQLSKDRGYWLDWEWDDKRAHRRENTHLITGVGSESYKQVLEYEEV